MKKKKLTVKEVVADLVEKRNRHGKDKQTVEERIEQLDRIYDSLLMVWEQCVLTAHQGGTGSITSQIERARLEIAALKGKDTTTYDIKIDFKPFEKDS